MFPVIEDFSDEGLNIIGYKALRVSIFDHWLSEEEANECDWINFQTAIKTGNLEEYINGEDDFKNLYNSICEDGEIIRIYNGEGYGISKKEFHSIMEDSLREKDLADIYIGKYDLRILGGYDRTDLLLVKKESPIDHIIEIVNRSGLHILP